MIHFLGTPGNIWVGSMFCKGLGSCVMRVEAGGSEIPVMNANEISFARLVLPREIFFHCV